MNREWGARSRKKESREQELTSEFQNKGILLKIEIFIVGFFAIFIFSKNSNPHYLGVGKAFLLNVGQRSSHDS
jgi:hypothetical protein